MSYLDTLIRASESPATDYHLCIFNYPPQRDDIYKFFTSGNILDMVSRITILEINLSNFERKYSLRSEAIYQLHQKGEAPKDEKFVADFGEWVNTYYKWQTCKKEYQDEVREFQRQTLELKAISPKSPKSESGQKIVNNNEPGNNNRYQLTKGSGAHFLISIAGIFDSNTKDTSRNVKTIVSEFILKKHGKIQNGSTN